MVSEYQIEIQDRSKYGSPAPPMLSEFPYEIVIITEDGSLPLALASSWDVARVLKQGLEDYDLDNIALTESKEDDDIWEGVDVSPSTTERTNEDLGMEE